MHGLPHRRAWTRVRRRPPDRHAVRHGAFANLTPDRQTGIGSWTSDQFYRAIHQGIDDDGHHLYPAFPFDYYTKVTRQDSDSIYDYLRTLAPVSNALQRDHLNFPFNIRGALVLWRWLYFKPGQFRPDPRQSAAWNRGAYLVQGLGHCGACHTPRSALGGPKRDQFLHGGAFQHWFAPDLTTDKRTGLGSWSRADIATYLREGRNARAEAAGEMGEVVAFSTSRLSDADRTAIVTYLTSIGPSSAPQNSAPPAQTMRRGGAIFVDACSACHGMDGRGQPGFFPPLAGSANAQQRDPTNSIRFILAGVRATPTDAHPSPLTMPPFDWKLNDEDVAAVATYVRNSWGNNAPSVSANDVNRLRRVLPSSQSARQPLQSSASRPNPMSLNPSSGD